MGAILPRCILLISNMENNVSGPQILLFCTIKTKDKKFPLLFVYINIVSNCLNAYL